MCLYLLIVPCYCLAHQGAVLDIDLHPAVNRGVHHLLINQRSDHRLFPGNIYRVKQQSMCHRNYLTNLLVLSAFQYQNHLLVRPRVKHWDYPLTNELTEGDVFLRQISHRLASTVNHDQIPIFRRVGMLTVIFRYRVLRGWRFFPPLQVRAMLDLIRAGVV